MREEPPPPGDRQAAPRAASFLARQLDGFSELLAGRPARLAAVLCGFLGALWLVVPVHELLHAAGCVLTGGTVSVLEVQPLWGGRLLHVLFPWVEPGGEYAGRLSGFSPSGDLSYLATVLLPHLVLAPLGAVIARAAARRGNTLLFGMGLSAAGQPLASISGDFYEAASISLTALARACGVAWAPSLRGDDLEKVLGVAATIGTPGAFALVATGAVAGGLLALALMRASGGIAPKSEPTSRKT